MALTGKFMKESTNHNQERLTIGFFNTHIGPEWASWPWQGMVDAGCHYDVNLLAFKRVRQLQPVAEVGTAASTILDIDRLLQDVVDLTRTRFDLYHAHIYLLNETQDTLVLKAGAGQKGRKMVAQGWSIPLATKKSLVARTARNRQGEIVNNVRQNPHWLPNPLLPDTRAELAVSLIVGEQLLGVLDVQADEVDYFTDEDVHIKNTLATQVAVAIKNAQLYLKEAERVRELGKLNEDLETARPNYSARNGWLLWAN
jgi:GAF domain-containing protein